MSMTRGTAFRLSAPGALLVALSGCYNNAVLNARVAPLRGVASPPICAQAVCTEQWQRAQLWIANHSKWKIQTSTDVVIQTFNPVGMEASYGFAVSREPLGEGRYRITMKMACGNALGCNPSADDVTAAFYHYVASGTDILVGAGNLSGIR
jgi:hypothetical protein